MGIVSGSVVHTIAAAFGLSAVIATSTRAFMIVKFARAAYLAYLGISVWSR
jgi:threonine/homoserine/homoserine lactone efflux protein